MNDPLVSVICLCYNQKRFVEESMLSVLSQTYKNIELIVIDDASNDGSQEVIRDFLVSYPQIQFLPLTQNVGNCKAFNMGWRLAKGEYIVDLSADDIMLAERIEKQVDYFQELDSTCGVVFTDCVYVDESGKPFRKSLRLFDFKTNNQFSS
ncbi:MAG: glycosyltransferase family A protein [Cyclobacteriaceae bacterium]